MGDCLGFVSESTKGHNPLRGVSVEGAVEDAVVCPEHGRSGCRLIEAET